MPLNRKNKSARNVILLTFTFLVIELLDELVDGVRGAAWPLIRNDLHLSYVQVGMLLTIPNTISSLIEPILGILGDIGKRRQLILGGGVAFAISLLLVSFSQNFPLLLAAFVLFYPASSILKGQLYTAMPGQSGTVMTLDNLFGLVSGFMPLILGLLATKYGKAQHYVVVTCGASGIADGNLKIGLFHTYRDVTCHVSTLLKYLCVLKG